MHSLCLEREFVIKQAGHMTAYFFVSVHDDRILHPLLPELSPKLCLSVEKEEQDRKRKKYTTQEKHCELLK